MSLLITILAFIVIFSLLILIHEFGHFYAAKKSGVKVEEFGMGLPPRIWGVKKGETLYSINWIPFGGFVRTLGESDTSTKDARTSKRSFANQSLRVQAFIVCAGVVMNFLLSFVLLTIGFWVGIEPLIANEEDFFKEIRKGTVDIQPGVLVVESKQAYNTVVYDDMEINVRSFEPGDRLLGYDTLEEWNATVEAIQAGGEAPYVSMDRADGTGGAELLTAELLDQTEFALLYAPRLVYKANEESPFAGLLEEGDVILNLASETQTYPILNAEDLYTALESVGSSSVEWTVYRPGLGEFLVEVPLPLQNPLISFIEPGSPAESVGLEVGDLILDVGGTSVRVAQDVVDQTQKATELVTYTVLREGEDLPLTFVVPIRQEDSRVGVGISDMIPYYGNLSLYETYTLHTLLDIEELRYGLSAPVVAVEEMWRLGKATALMFGDVLKQFVTANGVPEGVSGPVGIAQMTGLTIQDGFAATLRFVALLSLSLGVINILPLPALDGGHFFVILFRAITGKKPNPRYEQLIHSLGFAFLLLLIVYITFNDVLALF